MGGYISSTVWHTPSALRACQVADWIVLVLGMSVMNPLGELTSVFSKVL